MWPELHTEASDKGVSITDMPDNLIIRIVGRERSRFQPFEGLPATLRVRPIEQPAVFQPKPCDTVIALGSNPLGFVVLSNPDTADKHVFVFVRLFCLETGLLICTSPRYIIWLFVCARYGEPTLILLCIRGLFAQ